jgi:WD40 repeat protein
VIFPPHERRIISGSEDRTIKVWDARTGEVEKTLAGHSDTVNAVIFSPENPRQPITEADSLVNIIYQ